MLHNDKGTLNRVNDKVDKMRNESCLFVSWYKYEGNLNIGIILLDNFCFGVYIISNYVCFTGNCFSVRQPVMLVQDYV